MLVGCFFDSQPYQEDTERLIASHGGNEAITQIVNALASKILTDEEVQKPRTPNRGVKPSFASAIPPATAAGTVPATSVADPLDAQQRMLLKLSSEYVEDGK